MDFVKSVGTFFAALTGAFLSRQMCDELKAWSPRIVAALIDFAVRRLPPERRERFREEWNSHVHDVPGEIGKFIVASGFITAAMKISVMPQVAAQLTYIGCRAFTLCFGFVLVVLTLPTIMMIATIQLFWRRPILEVRNVVWPTGQETLTYAFSIDRNTIVGRFLDDKSLDLLPACFTVILGRVALTPKQVGLGIARLLRGKAR